MKKPLEGQVAIITGASRRIGKATALALAGQGADIVLTAQKSQAEINSVAEQIRSIGGRATPILCELRDLASVGKVIAAAKSEHGRLDILVNNAAIRHSVPFLKMSFEDWRNTHDIILDGCFRMCQAAIPLMLESDGGTIINVTGTPAYKGAPNRAHVVSAKAGMLGLTKAIAIEFAGRGITANCVAPGMIGGEEGSASDSVRTNAGIPLGRLGTVDEVAGTIVSLCMPHARFTTGQTLHVSGGLYIA